MTFAMFLILYTATSFLLGAMPFSVWMGRLILRTDVRNYGDGNPGAINAWRAGGYKSGLPAILLDYLKGAVPVSLASLRFGFTGWQLAVVALSPVLGHAFSPFLRFRGGKAVAVTFGIWTGLTLWEGPTILGIFLGNFHLLKEFFHLAHRCHHVGRGMEYIEVCLRHLIRFCLPSQTHLHFVAFSFQNLKLLLFTPDNL